MKKIIGFISLFICLFDPQIPFAPQGIGLTVLLTPTLFLIALLQNKNATHTYLLRQGLPFLGLMILFIIIITLRTLMAGAIFTNFILSWGKAFNTFLSIWLLFIVFHNKNNPSFMFKAAIAAYTLNMIINFVVASFPDSFHFLDLLRGERPPSAGNNAYRYSFISGSGFYSIGTAYGLFVLLYTQRIISHVSLPRIIAFCLLSITSIIAARTSAIAIALALIIIITKNKKAIPLLVIGISSTILLLILSDLSKYSTWLLNIFYAVNDASIKHLLNDMYYYPGDNIFLVGSGEVNTGKFTYTDSGYMSDILFGGVFYLLLKLAFPAIFFIKHYQRHIVLSLCIVLAMLIFHLKGEFIYQNAQGMAIFYFAYFLLFSKNEEQR